MENKPNLNLVEQAKFPYLPNNAEMEGIDTSIEQHEKYKSLSTLGYLKDYRQDLRNNKTTAEAYLWSFLKGKQLNGLKFRRQHSVGNYILDFYCTSIKLAIELDGAHHYTQEGIEKDKVRDAYLNELGITVLHIENRYVFECVEEVLRYVGVFIPPPPPLTGGETKLEKDSVVEGVDNVVEWVDTFVQ